MPLVKNNTIIRDEYVKVGAEDEIPHGGAIVLPTDRFLADPASILARQGPVGVIWPNNRDLDDLVPHLPKLAVVELVFPIFRDGRAYSQARLLRERHGYKGELRATGQVLRDQFVFMLRAGFDAFEVVKESDAEAFATVAKRYSVFYQPTAETPITAFRRRLALHRMGATT
jgi:uncharacterized protein (DUF934 family)